MSIGQRVKDRRGILNMSVEELAMKLNKSRATIYRYENGDIENLPIEILESLAEALETTPAYLMGWEEESNKDTTVIGELLKTIRIQQNITMEELSEEIGITPKDLRKYESGKKRIPADTMEIIRNYYRMSKNNDNNVRLDRLKIWSDNFDHVEFTDEEHDKIVEYAQFLIYSRKNKREWE